MNLFFPENPFHIKICSSARPLKIYFFLGEAFQNLFFPRRGLSIFFPWGKPLKIYFFLESASQNLFFPGERPPIFFPSFPLPPPQIINGRPLSLIQ